MKSLIFFLLLTGFYAASGQTQNRRVGGQDFVFKTESRLNEDAPDSIRKLTLYRDGKPLLTHTIHETAGDHNSEAVALGTFETTDSTIVFYSYWSRAGDAPASPYGVRKQVYSVGQNGTLRRTHAVLYIETARSGEWAHKGITYLFDPPQNAAQEAALQQYIREVETQYGGRFVRGRAQKALFREVRTKLKKEIAEATRNWKERYSNMLGGYKI